MLEPFFVALVHLPTPVQTIQDANPRVGGPYLGATSIVCNVQTHVHMQEKPPSARGWRPGRGSALKAKRAGPDWLVPQSPTPAAISSFQLAILPRSQLPSTRSISPILRKGWWVPSAVGASLLQGRRLSHPPPPGPLTGCASGSPCRSQMGWACELNGRRR